MKRPQARRDCEGKQATLLTEVSQGEINAVKDYINGDKDLRKVQSYWIDLRRNGGWKKGQYVWRTGEEAEVSDWAEGMPSGRGRCTRMSKSVGFAWKNGKCGRELAYICKYEAVQPEALGLSVRCQPNKGPACGTANSACITYRCKCVRYWVKDGDSCIAQTTLPLAARCTTPLAPCADPNSECRAYRCFCKAGYVKIGNACLSPSGYYHNPSLLVNGMFL